MENIAIVDENDAIIDYKEKMLVHEQGILHRAFSVVIFNSKDEMLLQRRSLAKYHSPGEWTNACCSHQRINESIEQAAYRRVYEELGIKDIKLEESFVFHYKCHFENGLWENEIDHVFIGRYDGNINCFNKEEVQEVKWIDLTRLMKWLKESPDQFTYWFKVLMKKSEEFNII